MNWEAQDGDRKAGGKLDIRQGLEVTQRERQRGRVADATQRSKQGMDGMGCVSRRPRAVACRTDWKGGGFRTEAVRTEIRVSGGGDGETLALKILGGRNSRW